MPFDVEISTERSNADGILQCCGCGRGFGWGESFTKVRTKHSYSIFHSVLAGNIPYLYLCDRCRLGLGRRLLSEFKENRS